MKVLLIVLLACNCQFVFSDCFGNIGVNAQVEEICNSDFGKKFVEKERKDDLKRTILFFCDPEKGFNGVRKVKNLSVFIEAYHRYLIEKNVICGNLMDELFNKHFKICDKKKARILTFLVLNTDGEYGEDAADKYTTTFKDNSACLISVLKCENWKALVLRLISGNRDSFLRGVESLGNTKFESEFKDYVASLARSGVKN